MDWGDFFDQFGGPIGQLFHYLETLTFVIPVVEIIKLLIAFAGLAISAYGVWKTWLYAETRIGTRLDEYLNRENDRLDGVREQLRAGLDEQKRPTISTHKIYSNRELNSALRAMKFGSLGRAKKKLHRSIRLSRLKRRLAEGRSKKHAQQIVLANLLQGALLDAEGDHAGALASFESVLKINPNDAEAIQYAGLQYLRLGQPVRALDLFSELLRLAKSTENSLLEFHAYRNLGICYEAPQLKQPGNSNSAFIKAIRAFPNTGRQIDLADVHEKRALANFKIKGNLKQAGNSATDALTVYSSVQRSGGEDAKEANQGLDRIHKLLKLIDDKKRIESPGVQASVETNLETQENSEKDAHTVSSS